MEKNQHKSDCIIENQAALSEKDGKKFEQTEGDVQNSEKITKETFSIGENEKLAAAKYVAEAIICAGIKQIKTGAVMSATISVSQNIVSVLRNEKEINEAFKDTSIDIVEGATTDYIIEAGGAAIQGVMQTSGNSIFQNLSRTNMAAMIATVSLQVAKSIVRYAKGDINEIELVEELGEKGTGMLAASWGASIGTVMFPGVGTVIGGMIGYMTSSTVYKSAMQVLQEERFSAEERKKVYALTKEAVEALYRQRNDLNVLIAAHYENKQVVFEESFDTIEESVANGDLELFTKGLNKIAVEMGESLQFRNFDEFDVFMCDQEMTLDF